MHTASLVSAHNLADEISALYAHINAATFSLLEKIRAFEAWLKLWLLAPFPKTEAAFREGRLSYSKARAVTRVANADNEHHFLNIAYHATASQTERIVRNHINVIAAAQGDTFSKRSLTFYWLPDGCLSFKGCLTADQEHDTRGMYKAVCQDQEPISCA